MLFFILIFRYVRYKEKSSAEQALIELVGRYDSLCLAPPSDIQADKFGYYTITFVNDKCLSKSDVWYIFSKVGLNLKIDTNKIILSRTRP